MHTQAFALASLLAQKPDDVIEVEIELDELDLTTAAYLENDNSQGMPKSEDSRQPQCPEEKGARGPVEHFGMI